MSAPHLPLLPESRSRGLASAPTEELADLFAGAWDAIIDLADRVTINRASRLAGWTVHDVLVHLGSWEEHPTFASLLDDATNNRMHDVDDSDARNALVVAAHHDATRGDITAALRAARDRGLSFLRSDELAAVGQDWINSRLGPLPVAGLVMASGFELAVHALDIAEPQLVPACLLDAGVAALVDLVGALASRGGLRTTLAVVTPTSSWVTSCAPNGWTTVQLPGTTAARELGWPAVEGRAPDVLDAAAGRQPATHLMLTRRLRPYDVPALLKLSGALEQAIELPGWSALRTAARALGQTTHLVGHLGGILRRDR